MLSDRPYMRGDYQRERTSVLTWLLSAIIAGSVVQLLLGGPWMRNGSEMLQALGLSVPAIRAGWVWTLLTHSFFHDPRFIILHVLTNLFALYMLGRELVPMLGRQKFLLLYAIAIVVGGLAWTAVHWSQWQTGATEMHFGATAAVYALFVVYACFFPNQELSFLLLFLFPVTFKPKYIAATLAVLDLVFLVAWEIPGEALPWNIDVSSSAHLGGMLSGFLFYRFVYATSWFRRRSGPALEQSKRARPVQKVVANATATPPTHEPEDLKAEVDRILDKINSQGFASLTTEEKRILDEARDQIGRR